MAAGQIRAPIIIPLKPPQLTKTKILTTDVKIDLVSESIDTDIYFTVNGWKPEPFKCIADKSTFKFSVPFCLPAGKRTVKAIAVSKDGSRESNVVTKAFDVEKVESSIPSQMKTQQDIYGFLDELKDYKKTMNIDYQNIKIYGQEKEKNHEISNSSNKQNSNLRSIVPQYLATRSSSSKKFGKSDYFAGLNSDKHYDMNESIDKIKKNKFENNDKNTRKVLAEGGSQSLRLQIETDFLKCAFCLAPRPTDLQAKFCNSCGQAIPPLPLSRLPPPENGQLGICIHCRSTVPMNVFNCLVCESPLNVQNQPQATNKLKDRILCTICGTANPHNLAFCLTCESKLPEVGKIAQTHLIAQSSDNCIGSKMDSHDSISIICNKCGGQNSMDARYCDWCGTQSNNQYSQSIHLICLKCGSYNDKRASYCGQCGNTLAPYQSQTDTIMKANGILKQEILMSQNSSLLIRQNLPCDASTQTVGLFFPSTAQLKINEDKLKPSILTDLSDRAFSSISPGKGFWRKQLDHIICHLKAHTSNSTEFQAMIGEPRMGKLITADVLEEEFELNLTLTFALKGYKDPYPREMSDDFDKRYLSSMLKRTGSFDSFKSDDTLQSNEISKHKKTPTTSSRCRLSKKRLVNKKSIRSMTEFILSDSDRSLLKEISKSGEGRKTEIERLFDEGANPKSKNNNGIPFIIIAVRNKHKDAIQMLCKIGANVNDVEPGLGNTPLHEAVLLGPLHYDVVGILLNCGSSVKIKNNKGENARDLAFKLNNEAAIKQFSSKIGKTQMEKLIQPKQFDEFDDDNI